MIEDLRITDEDAEILQALFGTRAWQALRKVFEGYRQACISGLMSAEDMNKVIETRGRILGLQACMNLPEAIVAQRKRSKK